jgi:hypothetical protein
MTEAASTSETSLSFYQTTRRNILEVRPSQSPPWEPEISSTEHLTHRDSFRQINVTQRAAYINTKKGLNTAALYRPVGASHIYVKCLRLAHAGD